MSRRGLLDGTKLNTGAGSGFLDECRLSLGVPVWLVGKNLGCAVVSQSGLLDESRISISIPETQRNWNTEPPGQRGWLAG